MKETARERLERASELPISITTVSVMHTSSATLIFGNIALACSWNLSF